MPARPASLLRRVARSFALFAVLAVVLSSCVLSPDRLLLYPSREGLASVGAVRRTVPFQGGALEIWTGRSRPRAPGLPPDAYVLRFYGNADRADPNVGIEAGEWTARPAVEIWGVNYPGYGGSDGPARLARIGPAALAAYDALRAEAGARPILVYGTSLGTAAALHVAARRPVAGVILQNPPPLRQIILRQYGWWNLWLLAGPLALRVPAALDSLANARACRAPGAFLLAGRDELVRPAYQRLVTNAYAGEKRLIPVPGAGHNDPPDAGALRQLDGAVEWMLNNAGGSRASLVPPGGASR